jgi:hypothetical protein
MYLLVIVAIPLALTAIESVNTAGFSWSRRSAPLSGSISKGFRRRRFRLVGFPQDIWIGGR